MRDVLNASAGHVVPVCLSKRLPSQSWKDQISIYYPCHECCQCWNLLLECSSICLKLKHTHTHTCMHKYTLTHTHICFT